MIGILKQNILIRNANNNDISAMDWSFIGEQLIEKIKPRAKSKGASQILVVCGAHDEPKRQFLRELGLNVASEWYISSI